MSNPTEKPAMLREQLALLQFAARNVAHAEATYNADALSCLSSVRATTEITYREDDEAILMACLNLTVMRNEQWLRRHPKTPLLYESGVEAVRHTVCNCHGELTGLLAALAAIPFVGPWVRAWMARRHRKRVCK